MPFDQVKKNFEEYWAEKSRGAPQRVVAEAKYEKIMKKRKGKRKGTNATGLSAVVVPCLVV